MQRELKAALTELEEIARDPALEPQLKSRLLDSLGKARKGRPLETDKWIYRMVVGFLGLAILGCLLASFMLQYRHPGQSIDMPEIFLAIGSAAVGALAGLLAPRPSTDPAS